MKKRIRQDVETVISWARQICAIPSPTGEEGLKAEEIKGRLGAMGYEPHLDAAGNVIAVLPGKSGKAMLYAAHMDTVFGGLGDIRPKTEGNRLYAPSIGDNSMNVAGLLYLAQWCRLNDWQPTDDMIFVFDVGEEGLGNLKGIKQAVLDYKHRLIGVVAVDGGYEAVADRGVGSRRYRVTITAEGGHSWADFGHDSAIAEAAGIIAKIHALPLAEQPKTTYNVG